jgi:hypothetical protein
MGAHYAREGIPIAHTEQTQDVRCGKVQRRQTKSESCALSNAIRNAAKRATAWMEFRIPLIVFLCERVQMGQKGLLNAAEIAAFERYYANRA